VFVDLWTVRAAAFDALGAFDLLARELDAVEIVTGAVEREGAGGDQRNDAIEGVADLVVCGERAEANGAAAVELTMAAAVAGGMTSMMAAETGAAGGDGTARLTV
jgi:hypothetical protein